MLKKRIIPKFLLRDGRLVKYRQFFDDERRAGNPVSTAKVYNDYGADEFIVLDIVPSEESKAKVRDIVKTMSEEIFMPFTVGGGVTSLDDVNGLLRAGADKVSVNSYAVRNPSFVAEAARAFGDQCMAVSIDYKEVSPGVPRVFIDGGREKTSHNPVDWALRTQDSNCGEILLTSIDRDGMMSGYDVDMIAQLDEQLDVPLVVSGGCGGLQHCIDAFASGASAVAISSLFLFTDHSPIKLRSHLVSNGINVRASKTSRN
ncbi:MAG: imidazole glycerol phosphate synthase subunit HisF [Rhodospirillaceae bacterium]|jgi:imidazole glycerol-phosphate synthase subunit HisF|nr:imidazole glycerol phosphate synthase subunit HisF [Rhodospirillaceae bacterium]MBT5564905.1 imidazole glycerol phosphate synthase subunit HisF [Rhodospirillaceae bacterium]MBT6090554.1 imidazole glycerol phosphate synthase subunit HisF [Rhodospirillaceae bacterium]MBT6960091.1 imidazole glycerol phosphate synthase subunit HisF [Rhodospirillaceae bacterium]MBT7450737.1 imidazole glycerol phosphate synthase subunit HisF [Rhodospirillaceae bacterium]